jgi:hypothetical protein
VNHEKGAVAAVRPVEGVGKASVDRKIEVRIRIHQLGRNCVEALWSLTIALVHFRPKIAGPPTDRIDLEKLKVAGGVLLPDFEFCFFLENSHQNPRTLRHMLLIEQRGATRAAAPLLPFPATDCRLRRGIGPAAKSKCRPQIPQVHARAWRGSMLHPRPWRFSHLNSGIDVCLRLRGDDQ